MLLCQAKSAKTKAVLGSLQLLQLKLAKVQCNLAASHTSADAQKYVAIDKNSNAT